MRGSAGAGLVSWPNPCILLRNELPTTTARLWMFLMESYSWDDIVGQLWLIKYLSVIIISLFYISKTTLSNMSFLFKIVGYDVRDILSVFSCRSKDHLKLPSLAWELFDQPVTNNRVHPIKIWMQTLSFVVNMKGNIISFW